MGEPLKPTNLNPLLCGMVKYLVLVALLLSNVVVHGQSRRDSLLAKIESLSEGGELADTYFELYKTYEGSDLKMATVWIDKLEALSDKIAYKQGKFLTLKARGKVHYFDKQPDSALVYFEKAFSDQLVPTALDSADMYNYIGMSYEAKGEIDRALDYLNKALKIYDRQQSDSGMLGILVNISNCFYESGNPEQALEYIEQAYELALVLQNPENISITVLNYAMLSLLVEGDNDKTDKLLAELENNPALKDNVDILAVYYQNMAVFYAQSEMPEEAETYYKRALETARSYSETIPPGIYAGLAQLHMQKGEMAEARTYYYDALKSASKKSDKRLVYDELARFYTEMRNIDSAAVYWEKSYQLLEDLEDERVQRMALESKNNIDLIQKESEIAMLEEQHKRNVLQKRIDRYTIIALVILMILLAVIAFLFAQQKRRQLESKERELGLKNQNLVNLSLHINQKNQLLKDFESTLAKKEKEAGDTDLYKAVKKALKESLRVDEDWKEFELYFNDLYSGFYDKLKNDYPELTNNELRVCSLARLRLSLKEMAQILFLSVDSVKSARYRIRKKLNLDTNEDLSDFLNRL